MPRRRTGRAGGGLGRTSSYRVNSDIRPGLPVSADRYPRRFRNSGAPVSAHDDLEAYVLGALESAEAAAFESHVVMCSDCRTGMASYSGVVRALRTLPVSAPPPAPSPRVRRARVAWISAVAAAAVIGIAIGRLFSNAPDTELAGIAEMVADHPREVALSGQLARGSAIVGAGGRRTAFVVEGLPPPPAGRGYQVWIRGARVASPGMLHRTNGGLEVLVLPGDALTGAQHIGVTVEPARGSPARTGPVVVAGETS